MTTHVKSAGEKSGSTVRTELTIFEILKQDHEKFRYLFDKIEKSGRRERTTLQKLFSQVDEELAVHMEGEERFLYPALERHEESREKVLESYEEHQLAKTLLGTFNSLAVDDERWGAKLSVLHQVLEHHMREEERALFNMAGLLLNKEQLQQIAARFQRHKHEGRRPTRGASVEG